MSRATIFIVFLSWFFMPEVYGDAEIPKLNHNPFSRPSLVSEIVSRADGVQSLSWSHVLQATLFAGSKSLANVDGRLIGIGEIHDGFRLTAVGEGNATFIKDGKTITVVVGGQDAINDEQ